MRSTSTIALITMTSASTLTGCYSTWDLSPSMVAELDGYGRKGPIVLRDGKQQELAFDVDTTLRFVGEDRLETSAQFTRIWVEGPIWHGIDRKTNETLHVDLRQLQKAQAVKISAEQTTLAAMGMVLAIPFSVGVVALSALSIGAEGRPLRMPGQTHPVLASMRETHRRGRLAKTAPMDDATRARLAAHWAQQASAECASIPAFLALARDLRLASAPSSLVHAALSAAREEAVHTELCTALANRHTESAIAPIVPRTPMNADVDRTALMKRLVLEAFWDGCVVEGAAAAEAQRSIASTGDEMARSALQTIAKDERGHAHLAQDILAWGLSMGERSARIALAESFEHARQEAELRIEAQSEPDDELAIDHDLAVVYGLAGHNVSQASRIEAWEKSQTLLARLG